jgi:hypothetical protein
MNSWQSPASALQVVPLPAIPSGWEASVQDHHRAAHLATADALPHQRILQLVFIAEPNGPIRGQGQADENLGVAVPAFRSS